MDNNPLLRDSALLPNDDEIDESLYGVYADDTADEPYHPATADDHHAASSANRDPGGGARCCGRPRAQMLNCLLLSFGFWGVFTAYNAVQNIEGTVLPGSIGFWSVSVIYVSFMACCLVGAKIVRSLGPKRSMMPSRS